MMKIYKWHPILALFLWLSIIISPELLDRKKITPALAETTLQDIKNHFAQGCIDSLLDKKIILGDYKNKTFRANTPVTRAEFAAMITQAFPDTKIVRNPINFVDIPQDYWGYDAIKKSYEMGFLSAYIGKTFNPTFKIKRWQVLTALSRGLNYQASSSSTQKLNKIFDDAAEIPEEVKKSIAAATEKGIVVNYPNVRLLNPNENATRSDVATFLCQAIVNNQKNSNEVIVQVPSEYIASFDKNTQLKTRDTLPKNTIETTKNRENSNLKTTGETSLENTNIPGIVERFDDGNLQAEIIYRQANNTDLVSDLYLKIIRGGKTILNQPIPVESLASASDSTMALLAGRFVKVQLLDLDGDKESEVLVDLFTINNSNAPFIGGTYSFIYRYEPKENQYTMLRHYWGNINYRVTDLDNDNIPEFKSFDSRFANVFSNLNDSFFPVRIFQYYQGEILDVTKKYPVQINSDASEMWLEFYRRLNKKQNVKGVLAAYLANKYMLGEKEEGWKSIESAYQGSDRSTYFANLRNFLTEKGYDTNQQIQPQTMLENFNPESQDNVSSFTNKTSPKVTTNNTENTEIKIKRPPQSSYSRTIPAIPKTLSPTENSVNSETLRQADITNNIVLAPKLVTSISNKQPDSILSLTISFNGKILASSSGKNIQLWNLETAKLLDTLSSHTTNVRSVAISPDGKTLASGSEDGTVKLWDISTGKVLTSFDHSGLITAVGFTADGRAVIGCSSDSGMKLWDIETGELLHRMNGTQPIAFGVDGLQMAASGGPRYIRLWNVAEGQLLKNLPIPSRNNNQGIQAIAFSQDGQTLAHAMRGESQVLVWNVETWEVRHTLKEHSQAIQAIAISPDGKILASSGEDGKIYLWDMASGKLLRSIKGYGAIVFSPDSQQLVSVTEDNMIQLWQIYGSARE